jgi:CHAT domain-containing protein
MDPVRRWSCALLLSAGAALAQRTTDLEKQAWDAWHRHDVPTARSLFDVLLERPDLRPEGRIAILDSLASIHLIRSEAARAVELLREAVAAARAAELPGPLLRGLASLAQGLNVLGAYEEAIETTRAGLRAAPAVPDGPGRWRSEADLRTILVTLLYARGELEESLEQIRQAIPVLEQLALPRRKIDVLLYRSICLFELGRTDEADADLAALAATAQAGGEAEGAAFCWRTRAFIARLSGRRTDALELIRRGEEVALPGGHARAALRRERGRVLAHADPVGAVRELVRAADLYAACRVAEEQGMTLLEAARIEALCGNHEEAAALTERAGKLHVGLLGMALVHRSALLADAGRWDEAGRVAEEALVAQRGHQDPRYLVRVLTHVGGVRLGRGDAAAAEPVLREARTLSERHHLPAREPVLVTLAAALERQGRLDEALEAARAAVELLEAGPSGRSMDEVLPGSPEPLEGLERLALASLKARPGAIDEAFRAAELLKARALLAALARSEAPPPPAEAGPAHAELRDALRARSALLEAQAGGAALARSAERTAEAARSLRAAAPRYAALHRPEPVPLERARELAPDGTVLVEFLWPRRFREGIAFVVTSAGARAVRLALPAGLESAIDAYTRALGTAASAADEAALRSCALRLREHLVRPWEEDLRGARRVIVIPDGPLHFLPFETLPAGDGGSETWADRWAVSYAPSATILHQQREGPAPPAAGVLAVSGDVEGLAGAAGELQLLGRELDGPVAVRSSISEARFRVEAALPSTVLHLAAHGVLDESRPDRSHLRLIAGGGEDGRLEARELFGGLATRADLAVLSACDTGRGVGRYGLGVCSLAWGFLHAGARSVVFTLWKVRDQDALRLMERFYRRLAAGGPRDEALAATKREARREGWPAAAWAPFVLIGDGAAPVPVRRRAGGGARPAALVGAGVALAAGLAALAWAARAGR